jgi:DNA-binding transcriptional regulator LsrR (DeoR family)
MITYISQAEAARRLDLTRQRVSALVKAGHLKGKLIAGHPVVSEQDLERFAKLPRKGGRPSSRA